MNIWKNNRYMTLLFWLASAHLYACTNDLLEQNKAYAADVQVRIDNIQTTCRIWTRNGKLRMALPSGQNNSTLLADFFQGKSWALFPALSSYREIETDNLFTSVPRFFDPTLKLKKMFIGQERLDGAMARIYKVTAHTSEGESWEGTLWESESIPGHPLKWCDAEINIEARWKNAALVEVPESFFEIPQHYTPQRDHSERIATKARGVTSLRQNAPR